MTTFINHNSFILTFLLAAAALAFFLFRDGIQRNDLLALLALSLGFAFAFLTFNAGESDLSTETQFDAALAAEQPVLLEIQSPYCLACATAKPIVDRIERNQPNLQVIRVNIQDPIGAELARRFQSRVTPTFLLFNEQGEIVLQTVGAIDPQAVAAELGESE